MEVVFLGTSCMVPTKERNQSGILLSYKNNGILMDCGEGIQRQLRFARIKPTKIDKILISHFHGDHVFGLPGLLSTLSASDYSGKLEIYGPKGTKKYIGHLGSWFSSKIDLDLDVIEIVKDGKIFENEDFFIEAHHLEHNIPSIGFKVIEKDRLRIDVKKAKKLGLKPGPLLGKLQQGMNVDFEGKKIKSKDVTYLVEGRRFGYISDTVFCKNTLNIAKDCDLLVCEATYDSSLEHKAEEYKHITSQQAGTIASKSNVKKLVLTHFSQRYNNTVVLLEDAKQTFDNTICAYDFLKIDV